MTTDSNRKRLKGALSRVMELVLSFEERETYKRVMQGERRLEKDNPDLWNALDDMDDAIKDIPHDLNMPWEENLYNRFDTIGRLWTYAQIQREGKEKRRVFVETCDFGCKEVNPMELMHAIWHHECERFRLNYGRDHEVYVYPEKEES